MNKNSRFCAVVSYITWIGFIIALVKRERGDTLVHRHLNQALILNLISTVSNLLSRYRGLSVLMNLVSIACLVLFIIGIIRAFQMNEEPLPIIGKYDLID